MSGPATPRLVSEKLGPMPGSTRERWSAVATHTHTIRSGDVDFAATKSRLVRWCRQKRIRAIGLGSPWEPVSAATYARCETTDRDRYYGGRIDPHSVMDRDAIFAMLDELNAEAGGNTLFYLDNETPKGRYGHLWYFGFAYMYPAFHDYSQDRPCQYFDADPDIEINGLTGRPHRRRSTIEILHEQRRHGALGVWAHPTSWWWADRERRTGFTTNIASECVQHLLMGGFLDGLVVMGYDACHRWYQRLWFHLLDTGATVPCFAETDYALDSAQIGRINKEVLLTYMPLGQNPTASAIADQARRGCAYASTGAHLALSVDDTQVGQTAATSPDRIHRISIEAYPPEGQSCLSRVELVSRGGHVIYSRERFGGGVLSLEVPGGESHGYLVARAFGEDDGPDAERQQSIRHAAITNPVYLRPPGFEFEPVLTEISLAFDPTGPWIGGEAEFLDPAGTLVCSHRIRSGELHETLPANTLVRLTSSGSEAKSFYPAVENERVQGLLRYLYAGEFLRDYPGLSPGEVPHEAFRVEEMRAALSRFERRL